LTNSKRKKIILQNYKLFFLINSYVRIAPELKQLLDLKILNPYNKTIDKKTVYFFLNKMQQKRLLKAQEVQYTNNG
jgi:hypothetical protein